MVKQNTGYIAVFSVLIIVLCCLPPAAAFGNSAWQKIFIVDFIFDDNGVTEESAGIWYGTTPDLDIQSGPIEGVVTDAQKATLMYFYLRDPRYQIGDTLIENADGTTSVSEYIQYTPSVEIRIVLPYSEQARTLSLIDRETGSTLATVDLAAAGTRLAEMYPEELEFHEHVTFAGSVNADYRPLFFFIAGLILIAASICGYVFYARKL